MRFTLCRAPAARIGAIALLACLIGPAPVAEAIVLRHDKARERSAELAADFPAVGCVAGMYTGTLVAPQWVLTCAHGTEAIEKIVVDASRYVFEVGGDAYRVTGIAMHPDRQPIEMVAERTYEGPADEDTYNRHDIALLRLELPVPGVEPVTLYTGKNEVGQSGVLVGCGPADIDPRTGLDGGEASLRPRGELRAGWNRIDRLLENSKRLVATFDSPEDGALELEAGVSPGDSGGPFLILDAGVWKIAGVVASTAVEAAGRIGAYGDQPHWTQVSEYVEWIQDTIREDAITKRIEPAGEIEQAEPVDWPATPAGRLGRAFMEALNAPDDGPLRRFFLEHYSESALENSPVDERVRLERGPVEAYGPFRALKTEAIGDFGLRIVARAEGVGMNVEYIIQFSEKPPHQIREKVFGPATDPQ